MDLLKTVQNDNGNVASIFSADRGFFVKAKTPNDPDFTLLDFYYDIESANIAADVLVKGLK